MQRRTKNTLRRRRRPTTAGRILTALYLEPREISVSEFARAVGCSRKHMSDIVNGRVEFSADIAFRMAAVLGTTPQLWMNLQTAVSLFDAEMRADSWKPAKEYKRFAAPKAA